MLADTLKTQTRLNHQVLEKQLITRIKGVCSENDYVELLQLFYTYFGAIEEKTTRYILPLRLPDYHQRRKSQLILNDIESFGAAAKPMADDSDLPAIKDTASALGALYVIEGSTLGGPVISKMIAQKLQRNNNDGFSFFLGYGNATETMWESFKSFLNTQASIANNERKITRAANETFEKFKIWIEKNG